MYSAQDDKWKYRVVEDKKPNGGETLTFVKCFKCDKLGQHDNEFRNKVLRGFKYGKTGHHILDCKSFGTTYYNCDEQGLISTNYQKLKKA